MLKMSGEFATAGRPALGSLAGCVSLATSLSSGIRAGRKALQRRRNRNCADALAAESRIHAPGCKAASSRRQAELARRHHRAASGLLSDILPRLPAPAVGLRAWLKDSPAESSDSLVALHVDLMAVGYRCPISQEGPPAMIRTRVHSHIHRFHEGRTKLLMIAGAAFLFVTGCSKTDIEQTGTSSFTHARPFARPSNTPT